MSDSLSVNWLKYAWNVILYVAVMGSLVVFSNLWLSSSLGRPAGLVETILLVKLSSLVTLIAIGGYELAKTNSPPRYLTALNVGVLVLGALSTVAIAFKLAVFIEAIAVYENGPFRELLNWTVRNSEVISISPIVVYGLINLLAATIETILTHGNKEIARHAASYLSIADIPCVVPILSIFLLTGIVGDFGGNTKETIEIFVSGAMAMFIFASNLLSISVKHVVVR